MSLLSADAVYGDNATSNNSVEPVKHAQSTDPSGLWLLVLCIRDIFSIITLPTIRSLLSQPLNAHIDPYLYLKSSSEAMFICLGLSWVVTLIFNMEIVQNNPLNPPIGYSNLCVGFDTPPARYVAMPFMVPMQ